MRCAILLAKGKYADEVSGFDTQEGPRADFVTLAKALDAPVFSYMSAKARRGGWFARTFGGRPIVGSALDFAVAAGRFDRCYITGEDVGLLTAALLRARRWKGRLYMMVHNVTPKRIRLFRLIGHKPFGMLITNTQRLGQLLIDECGIPPEKVMVVHDPIDTRFFHPAETAPPSNAPATFMACGAENRDYPSLLAAIRGVDAELKLFAHGFFGANKGAAAAEADSRVRRMPRVPFGELVRHYQESDLVVVPINASVSASGVNGLLEAMACGKLVVVTKTAGIVDYLESVDPELQARANDVDDLARAMRRGIELMRNPARDDGAANRAWVAARCSIDDYVVRVRDIMLAA